MEIHLRTSGSCLPYGITHPTQANAPRLNSNRWKHVLYDQLMVEFRNKDCTSFTNFLRLPSAMFDALLARVSLRITKQYTFYRDLLEPGMTSVTLPLETRMPRLSQWSSDGRSPTKPTVHPYWSSAILCRALDYRWPYVVNTSNTLSIRWYKLSIIGLSGVRRSPAETVPGSIDFDFFCWY